MTAAAAAATPAENYYWCHCCYFRFRESWTGENGSRTSHTCCQEWCWACYPFPSSPGPAADVVAAAAAAVLAAAAAAVVTAAAALAAAADGGREPAGSERGAAAEADALPRPGCSRCCCFGWATAWV